MTHRFDLPALAAGALLTLVWGSLMPTLFAGRLPQAAGEDIMAMLLGDARQVLSAAMLTKADDYFHGGAQHSDCTHGLAGPQGGAHAHDHGHPESHADEHPPDGNAPDAPASRDPWAWLNARVHVQAHRHTEGEDARELLPWLWAACRTSPSNIQAFESSAYVLERMLKRPLEALALLEEGTRLNPSNAAIEVSLGELALHSLKDPVRAEQAFEAARTKCRPAPGEAGEDDRFLLGRILFYLGYLARQRGDLDRAGACLTEAEAQVPDHVGTRNLRKLLRAPRAKESGQP